MIVMPGGSFTHYDTRLRWIPAAAYEWPTLMAVLHLTRDEGHRAPQISDIHFYASRAG
jgi:hypothetical protein